MRPQPNLTRKGCQCDNRTDGNTAKGANGKTATEAATNDSGLSPFSISAITSCPCRDNFILRFASSSRTNKYSTWRAPKKKKNSAEDASQVTGPTHVMESDGPHLPTTRRRLFVAWSFGKQTGTARHRAPECRPRISWPPPSAKCLLQ